MPELVPQMKMLFPWLTICLDKSQVKSWCLSSRDAVIVIAGSLTCHTCLEKKLRLRLGGWGGSAVKIPTGS